VVASDAPRISLTLLTGFLGAGKTTLVNRLLAADQGEGMAVLVNDFGQINIDSDLIVGVEAQTVSLANGCVCCSIQGELVSALEALAERSPRPRQVLLEASGVADPAAIATTLVNDRLANSFSLDGIICVVDGEGFLDPDQLGLKVRQALFADLILLNKRSLVGEEGVQAIRDRLAPYIEHPRYLECDHCDVPLELILGEDLGSEQVRKARVALSPHHHDHEGEFARRHWCKQGAIPVAQLRQLMAHWPSGIYRAKGILADEEDGRPWIMQRVGERVELRPGEARDGSAQDSRLVMIGRREDVDAPELVAAMDQLFS
jgi:G3E family GTPase